MHPFANDTRTVLTLETEGTHFAFQAMQRGAPVATPILLPAAGDHLATSLRNMRVGFEGVLAQLEEPAVAISFAFPGPADYAAGIIDNRTNLPAYRGGVPLKAWLEQQFRLPIFLNNDGDLFAYGEAIAGLLPQVNARLASVDNPRRYRNLLGVTLGAGFGGGFFAEGNLLRGDNSNAMEIWLTRSLTPAHTFSEECISVRALRRSFSSHGGMLADETTPEMIAEHARQDDDHRDTVAARKAFDELGAALGEALANALNLLDALVVIGGELAAFREFFMPSVLKAMRTPVRRLSGGSTPRLIQTVFDLDDEADAAAFHEAGIETRWVPGSNQTVVYDPLKRTGIASSRLGTRQAVMLGAYAYALDQLNRTRNASRSNS